MESNITVVPSADEIKHEIEIISPSEVRKPSKSTVAIRKDMIEEITHIPKMIIMVTVKYSYDK